MTADIGGHCGAIRRRQIEIDYDACSALIHRHEADGVARRWRLIRMYCRVISMLGPQFGIRRASSSLIEIGSFQQIQSGAGILDGSSA